MVRICIAILSLFLLPAIAAAQECTELARVIGREASRFGDSQQIETLRMSNLCSARYESSSNEQKASIEGSYGMFSGGASGSSEQIHTMQEQKCGGRYGSYWSSKITSQEIQNVSQIGAEVVRACLNARSFRLTNLEIVNEAVTSTFRYGGTGDTIISGIALIPPSIGKCFVHMNGREQKDLGQMPGTHLSSGDTLAVNCQRVGAPVIGSSPERQRYRGGILSVTTQSDNVSVPLLEYSVPQAPEPVLEQLRSEIATQRTGFESSISDLRNRIQIVADQFAAYKDSEQAGVAVQTGHADNGREVAVLFARPFKEIPMVYLSKGAPGLDSMVLNIVSVSQTGFRFKMLRVNGNGWDGPETIYWIALAGPR